MDSNQGMVIIYTTLLCQMSMVSKSKWRELWKLNKYLKNNDTTIYTIRDMMVDCKNIQNKL